MPKSISNRSRRSHFYDLPQIINMASSKVLLEMKYAKPEDEASQLTIKKNELYSEGQFSDLKKNHVRCIYKSTEKKSCLILCRLYAKFSACSCIVGRNSNRCSSLF